MIRNVQQTFAVPRSARIVRAALSAARVGRLFNEVRSDLDATTKHREIGAVDGSGVVWSLWIGRFSRTVTFLLGTDFREERYGYVLLLEHDGFVGILSSGVGDIGEAVADSVVSYQALLALRSGESVEVESISTRSLRAARVGVMRSTQTGRYLERALPRVGANQSAPFQVAVRDEHASWRISPSSGRVAQAGGRATIAELCAWFRETCNDLQTAGEPSDFMKAFAHPVALSDLPTDVVPTALQLDSVHLLDRLDSGAHLERSGVPLTDTEVADTVAAIRALWIVGSDRTGEEIDSKTFQLMLDNATVGKLVVRATKISFASDHFADVQVVTPTAPKQTLSQLFNVGSQPLRITFSDPSFGYAAGQLFRDHRLLGSRTALLQMLSGSLPGAPGGEKDVDDNGFSGTSLFGYVVHHASHGDSLLVCDDLASEWADFIGVAPELHRVSFYHCKAGTTNVGASELHEVVSQAVKNLGYLTASPADLEARRGKWAGTWGSDIARLHQGGSVKAFTDGFSLAVASPRATRRVVIVTSGLSRGAVESAFETLHASHTNHSAAHVLWLLSSFADQCRAVGAIPEIICRP